MPFLDLPNEVLLHIAYFLFTSEQQYNANPRIFGHFSYTSQINPELVSLSSTSKRLRDLLGPIIFQFISLVRKNEHQAIGSDGSLQEAAELTNRISDNPGSSFLKYAEFLEAESSWFSKVDGIHLPNLKHLKLFNLEKSHSATPESESSATLVHLYPINLTHSTHPDTLLIKVSPVALSYLSLDLSNSSDIVYSILSKTKFSRLSRLDILIDFTLPFVKSNYKLLSHIASKYTNETSHLAPEFQPLKELNILSRGFALSFTLSFLNGSFIQIFKRSLIKLSFNVASVIAPVLLPIQLLQKQLDAQRALMGPFEISYFYDTVAQLLKLQKLSFSSSILTALTPSSFPFSSSGFTLASLYPNFNMDSNTQKTNEITFELDDESSSIFPTFTSAHKLALLNLIKHLPPFVSVSKFILHYHKEIEQPFLIIHVAMQSFLHTLFQHQSKRIKVVQLHWVWSYVDRTIISDFDNARIEKLKLESETIGADGLGKDLGGKDSVIARHLRSIALSNGFFTNNSNMSSEIVPETVSNSRDEPSTLNSALQSTNQSATSVDHKDEAENIKRKIFEATGEVYVRTPRYARIDGCTPDFRVPELFYCDYGDTETNVNENDTMYPDLKLIDEKLDEKELAKAQLDTEDFWSREMAVWDLDS